jgi:hypothetical protein
MIWNLKLLAAAATGIAILLAGTAWYSYSKGLQLGIRQVEIQWQEAMRLQANAEAEEVMKARQQEQALAALLVKQRMEHQREVKRLVSDYAAVVVSLHDRPEAGSAGDSGVPQDTNAGTEPAGWCTGARLYRDHATAFAGESALAAQLQSALRACIAHATAIERELNKE